MDFETIRADFEALEPGEERYRYLIDLGRQLPGVPDEIKTEAYRVHGCQSQVWMRGRIEDGRLRLEADSDAFIVRGLVAILLAIFDDHTPAEVLAVDAPAAFGTLQLDQHLSMGRRNGLYSMVGRVRALAEASA